MKGYAAFNYFFHTFLFYSDPDYAEAYSNLAKSYMKLNKYQETIDAYKQVIRIKPNYEMAHLELGIAYLSFNKTQEAIDALKQLIKISPDFAPTYLSLGSAYLSQWGLIFHCYSYTTKWVTPLIVLSNKEISQIVNSQSLFRTSPCQASCTELPPEYVQLQYVLTLQGPLLSC